VKLNSEVTIKL